ncbi:MAG: tetraacyldisaccharide 4'-kinase [Rickettsiella sp.]|nr:tetraacyldisaccharide 4'-kinase [Rickettsiella sp.]
MLTIWKNKNFIAYLLWPFSLLYRLIIFFRGKLYQFHIKKITLFSVPIIVIGNITVGGSGKTPLLIEIAQFLKNKGWRPGVISRGYMGKTDHYPCRVHMNSNPREVGDEPLLIAQATGCPTLVDPERSRGIKTLLGKTNCNIVLSDDGLQHLALGRDIEIAVVDGQRRFGNGFCLPAGPLREPLSRLKKVDFIVSKGKAAKLNEYEMLLIPDHFYQLIQPQNKKNLGFFYGKKLHVVAGIGNPDQFFSSLRTLGLTFIEHPFPDHHFFKPNDFNYGNEAIIIMTEKDAVKCTGLVDTRLWCLRSKTKLDESFFDALLRKITIKQKEKNTNH